MSAAALLTTLGDACSSPPTDASPSGPQKQTLFKQVLAKHQVPAPETRELLAIVASTKADIVTGVGAGPSEGRRHQE